MTADPGRVSFQFTEDEMLDVSMRVRAHFRLVSRARRNFRIALAAGVAVSIMLAPIKGPGGASLTRADLALIGVILGLLAFAGAGPAYDQSVRKTMRKLIRERLSAHPDCMVDFELRPDGLWVRQSGVEILHPWKELKDLAVTSGDVEFVFSGGGVSVVRARAFATPGGRDYFVARARELSAAH